MRGALRADRGRMPDLFERPPAAGKGGEDAGAFAALQALRRGVLAKGPPQGLCRRVGVALALTCAFGCSPAPPAVESAQRPAAPAPWRLPEALSPTDVDPEGLGADIEQALAELRVRTRCNDVSGCPAADLLRAAGPKVVRPLLNLAHVAKPRAPWLPRVTSLLGELGDDAEVLATLQLLSEREEDAVRAAALLSLWRRDAIGRDQLQENADADAAAAVSRSRLVARWALAASGDAEARGAFYALTLELTQQLVAADSVRFAAWLCGQAAAPACDTLYEPMAKHPAFLVRRDVMRRIRERPHSSHIPALRLLAGDPIGSLSTPAAELLRGLESGPAFGHRAGAL